MGRTPQLQSQPQPHSQIETSEVAASPAILFAMVMAVCLALAVTTIGCSPMQSIQTNKSSTESLGPGSGQATPPGPTPIDDGPSADGGNVVSVSTAATVLTAIDNAQPGDVITLAPGTYDFTDNVRVDNSGTETQRIFLRAATAGSVTIRTTSIEGFKLYASYWVFENLVFKANCAANSSDCEHIFHVVSESDHDIFRYNEFVDYASAFKINQENDGGGTQHFPDNLQILRNKFYNTRANTLDAPHNMLNIDGGDNHVIAGNIFADFTTGIDTKPASAILLKSGARFALVEKNLIICKKNITNANTVRAIILGEGTMSSAWPAARPADVYGESVQQTIRNNIFMNCQGDGSSASILIADDSGSNILHNTSLDVKSLFVGPKMYDTTANRQILPTRIQSNILNNGLVLYDTGADKALDVSGNLETSADDQLNLFPAWAQGDLTAISTVVPNVSANPAATQDFCGYERGALTSAGAVDYGNPAVATCLNKIKLMYNYETLSLAP